MLVLGLPEPIQTLGNLWKRVFTAFTPAEGTGHLEEQNIEGLGGVGTGTLVLWDS